MEPQERTTRYRAANIHNHLNKNKVRSLKLLAKALKGEDVLASQIQAARATLELLSIYEPAGIQTAESAL
jgi:hypothetical protein|tara:strand:+ start:4207 stop:4416 length:210 start_codon:yes stop_codon:yes gene_type:complete